MATSPAPLEEEQDTVHSNGAANITEDPQSSHIRMAVANHSSSPIASDQGYQGCTWILGSWIAAWLIVAVSSRIIPAGSRPERHREGIECGVALGELHWRSSEQRIPSDPSITAQHREEH